MTALLVLLTCAIFLTIDYVRSRKRARVPAAARESAAVKPLVPVAAIVGGFEVRENLRYHPGHTWALAESPNLVRVGLDDFAAQLLGKIDSITLPKRGQWIRQGQRIVKLVRDGVRAELVSPVEGEVANVNQTLLADRGAAARDPYGEGWLLTVHSPDAETSFRNLLGGSLARRWMDEAAARLRMRMPALAGAVAQDGGRAVNDLAAHLPDQEWSALAKEFFLM